MFTGGSLQTLRREYRGHRSFLARQIQYGGQGERITEEKPSAFTVQWTEITSDPGMLLWDMGAPPPSCLGARLFLGTLLGISG